MTRAVVRSGYRYAGESVEISQPITEAQFRAVERILGEPPARFKSYAEAFHFQPTDPRRTSGLLGYLRRQGISHSIELLGTWAAGQDTAADPAPPAAEPVDRRAPSVSELVALAARGRLSSEDLDEDVHDAASEDAANVNSEGLDGQIAYLVQRLGARETQARVERTGRRDLATASPTART